MSQLANKPAPHLISFDRSCFEQDGERIEFVVGRLAPSYPLHCATREEALKHGAPTELRIPILRRVRWTA